VHIARHLPNRITTIEPQIKADLIIAAARRVQFASDRPDQAL